MISLESPHMGLSDTRAEDRGNMSLGMTVTPTDNPGPIIEVPVSHTAKLWNGKASSLDVNVPRANIAEYNTANKLPLVVFSLVFILFASANQVFACKCASAIRDGQISYGRFGLFGQGNQR